MKHDSNIYESLKSFLNIEDYALSVAQRKVDTHIKDEFRAFALDHKRDLTEIELLAHKNDIFNEQIPVDTKKSLLLELGISQNIEALRTLEQFVKLDDNKLSDWAYLALQEGKMLFESNILELSQLLIYSGLGGKGLKLRYFCTFFTAECDDFSDSQQKALMKELNYQLTKVNGELEQIKFDRYLAPCLVLLPLKSDLKEVFKSVIQECNALGSFLHNDFILSNNTIMDAETIEEIIAVNYVY